MNIKTKLDNLVAQMQRACEQKEWESVVELDEDVKTCVSALVSAVKNEQQRALVTRYLTHIQTLYSLMIKDGEKHREEISQELKKLSRDQKAVNSYLDSASY